MSRNSLIELFLILLIVPQGVLAGADLESYSCLCHGEYRSPQTRHLFRISPILMDVKIGADPVEFDSSEAASPLKVSLFETFNGLSLALHDGNNQFSGGGQGTTSKPEEVNLTVIIDSSNFGIRCKRIKK